MGYGLNMFEQMWVAYATGIHPKVMALGSKTPCCKCFPINARTPADCVSLVINWLSWCSMVILLMLPTKDQMGAPNTDGVWTFPDTDGLLVCKLWMCVQQWQTDSDLQ